MPFAGYPDFKACVRANQDKKDPEAYCATIHFKSTGKWPGEMRVRAAREALHSRKKGK